MKKSKNTTMIQRSIVIPKEIEDKINNEAEENFSSANWVVRKILTDYYKNKEIKND